MNHASEIKGAAERLFDARRLSVPILPSALPPLNLEEAYRVQDELTDLTLSNGEIVAGWKVGLTSGPAMAAFGASEPIAGRLFAETILPPGSVIDFSRTCDARVEGEIVIEIGQTPRPPFDDQQLYASIASVRPAIEIADSRIAGWPTGATAAIADDACCGWVIVGEKAAFAGVDLAETAMRLSANGRTVAEGVGSNCLGSPLNVYRWFLEKAVRLGWKIEPGHFLLTGAIAPPVLAADGCRYEAYLDGLGRADFSFGRESVA